MMKTLETSLYENIYWINEKWQCSHCSMAMYDYNKMVKHEDQCEYNPENKRCSTCDSNCRLQPGTGICGRWKNLKFERTKKLTLLKNKINAVEKLQLL